MPKIKTSLPATEVGNEDDSAKFRLEIGDATGFRAPETQTRLLAQIIEALWRPGSKKELDESELEAIAELLDSIGPRDGPEGLLAVQMIATHDAAMHCLRNAASPDQRPEARDQNLKHAAKLLGVYERQMSSLDNHRSKRQQTVNVEHVHVNDGGQAIVGNVTRGGSGRESGSARGFERCDADAEVMAADVSDAGSSDPKRVKRHRGIPK